MHTNPVYHGIKATGKMNPLLGRKSNLVFFEDWLGVVGKSKLLSQREISIPYLLFTWGKNGNRNSLLTRHLLIDCFGRDLFYSIPDFVIKKFSEEVVVNLPDEEWYLSWESIDVYMRDFLEVL